MMPQRGLVKVLIAEDDAVSRLVLQGLLPKWGYEVVAVDNGISAWNILREPDAPKLCILDWMMPGLDGPALCRKVRATERGSLLYIVLLTARSAKEDLVEGMNAGADDYVGKPFDRQELQVRLRAGARIIELHDALVASQEQLLHQATTDALTELSNHGAIRACLRTEQQRSRREGHPMCIILGDLDHFKAINDTFGHLAGDAVLREVARRIKETVRTYDGVGRYGGEEFLVVLPNCTEGEGRVVAERIRRRMEEQSVNTSAGAVSATISLGLAALAPLGETAEEDFLKRADAAMYRAKRCGRNHVEVAA